MSRAFAAASIAALVFATGCSDTAGPAGACQALVNVAGTMYTPAPGVGPAPMNAISAEPVTEVAVRKPCSDVNPMAGANTLQAGESNFLAAGTRLHAVDGYAADERLAYLTGPAGAGPGEWRVIVPVP